MFAEFRDCAVLVAIVEDGAVVRAEDDEGFLGQVEAVQRFHDLADTPIEFEDGVAAQAGSAFPLEALVGHAGDVDVVRCEV